MSDQTFLTYWFDSAQERDLVASRLRAAQFAVSDAKRMGPALNIRIRRETADQSEVERILSEIAPKAEAIPGGTPTVNLVGYREGL